MIALNFSTNFKKCMIIDRLISCCLRKAHNYGVLAWHNEFIKMGVGAKTNCLNKKHLQSRDFLSSFLHPVGNMLTFYSGNKFSS